jgi:hypothetical protein
MAIIETGIGALIVAGIGYALYKMVTKKETAQEAVKEVLAEVKAEAAKVADVNNDGKVDIADAVEVVKKTKAVGKKVAAKVTKKKTTKADK